MYIKQSESARQQGEAQAAHLQGEITQQATTPTQSTTTQHASMWLLANWLLKERSWPATTENHRTTEKAAAEAAIIIANNKVKATTAAPEPSLTTENESPRCSGEKNSSLSITQWLAVGSLVV